MKSDYVLFAPFAKIDGEKREVYGYASTPTRDQSGETMALDAVKAALPKYLQYPAVREMHQPSAVGTGIEANLDQKGLWFGAKIVDDQAWRKVQDRVYRGFSVGGRVTKRDPKDPRHILGIDLVEVSLVDRPCNPDAKFELVKRDQSGNLQMAGSRMDGGNMKAADIDALAKACLPSILAKALPNGHWMFGGTYSSPSPLAVNAARERTDAIVVNSKGAWRDNLANVHGIDVVSLLSHLRKVDPSTIRQELMRTLNPADAMNGQIVPSGLRARSKEEDVDPDDRVTLDAVALLARREGLRKNDALYQYALRTRRRK